MAKRAPAPPPVIPGFSYVRVLGSGGFADVYQYHQDMPRRVVAVKVLLNNAINPEVLRTFNAEADIMARLSAHPSIVTIYQASIAADGRPYLVMEYCPDTMSTRYKKGPLPIGEVLDVGVRVAAALETAHRAGLLHRDIKPSNILVTSLGTPVLADFGIATVAEAEPREDEVFALSVPWSAPEVVAENDSGSVASEVWSLGATLYTLLAGRSPFELPGKSNNAREQLSARIHKARYTPISRLDVSDAVQSLLATSMSKDPAKRFSSLEEFAEALRSAQYSHSIPPTALEVATPEWGEASLVSVSDEAWRMPQPTTVAPESRLVARKRAAVATAPSSDGVGEQERVAQRRLKPAMVAVIAAIGIVVAGLVTVLVVQQGG